VNFTQNCPSIAQHVNNPPVDYMLDDCFQLISLAYLTVGKNHEPPAVCVKKLLLGSSCANVLL
jgi:hypothetical protein